MRTLCVAALLVVVFGAPAFGASAWVQTGNGVGSTDTRLVYSVCGQALYAAKFHGTTNPATLYVYGKGGDVVKVVGRQATNFNEVTGAGCGTTNNRAYLLGRGRWGAYSPMATLGTWTSFHDTSHADQAYGGAVLEYGVGIGLVSSSDLATDTFSTLTWDLAATWPGPSINAVNGFANYEETGVRIADVASTANDFYCGATLDRAASTGPLVALGIDGSGNSRWTQSCSGTVRGCDSNVAAHQIRQSFSDSEDGSAGTLCVVPTYNTSTGASYMSAWDSSGVLQIQQTISSVDIRCGFTGNLDGASAMWAISSSGAAYKSTGSTFTAQSAYNLTPDGGETVTGCANISGYPVVLTSGGDVWTWKTVAATTYVRSSCSGPFRW